LRRIGASGNLLQTIGQCNDREVLAYGNRAETARLTIPIILPPSTTGKRLLAWVIMSWAI